MARNLTARQAWSARGISAWTGYSLLTEGVGKMKVGGKASWCVLRISLTATQADRRLFPGGATLVFEWSCWT